MKILMLLNFQNKVISFTLTNMLYFYVKIIEAKKEDVKVKTLKKWSYCESTFTCPFLFFLLNYHIFV